MSDEQNPTPEDPEGNADPIKRFGYEDPAEMIKSGEPLARLLTNVPFVGLDTRAMHGTIQIGFSGDERRLIAGVLFAGPGQSLMVDPEMPGLGCRAVPGDENHGPLAVQVNLNVEQITSLINVLIEIVAEMETSDTDEMIEAALDSLSAYESNGFDPEAVDWGV